MGVVFLGVAVLGPIIAAPISGALGIPIQKLKGITGAARAREREAQPEAHVGHRRRAHDRRGAGRAHHRVRRVGAHVGERGDRPVDEGRLRRHVTAGSGRARSRSTRAARAGRRLPEVTSASAVQSGQAKIDGSVDAGHRRRPGQDRLAVRPRAHGGQDQRRSSANGIAVLDNTASDNGWKLGDTVPITFAQTGQQEFTVESIYDADRVHQLRDHASTPYEKNFTDQFDFQIYVSTKGGVTPANTRRDQEGDEPVPRAEGARTATSSRPRRPRRSTSSSTWSTCCCSSPSSSRLFGIANTLGLSIIERTPRARAAARGGHDPPPAAFERALGSR